MYRLALAIVMSLFAAIPANAQQIVGKLPPVGYGRGNNIVIVPGYGGFGYNGGCYNPPRSWNRAATSYGPAYVEHRNQYADAFQALGWMNTYNNSFNGGGQQWVYNPYVTQPGEKQPRIKPVSVTANTGAVVVAVNDRKPVNRRGVNVIVNVPPIQYVVYSMSLTPKKGEKPQIYGVYTNQNVAIFTANQQQGKALGVVFSVEAAFTNRK